MDGVCNPKCSGDPRDTIFDTDCFSSEAFDRPTPDAACRPKSEPCEIHEGINRMGAMFESGIYDNTVMLAVILSYWDSSYWDLPDRWGAHALDGYVVYAIVRTAMKYHQDIESQPATKLALESMLRDHADRGVPATVRNGERWFHGGSDPWNSWSEDYMGFALGYAAADAWLASPWPEGDYYDQYFDKVDAAVRLAFSVSDQRPHTLRFEADIDPLDPEGTPYPMIRNHDEYSPVYAMGLLKHLWDVNTVYLAAGLPVRYTCWNKPETYDHLYLWVTRKIEPNLSGPGYVFRSNACQRKDGVLSYCDDRPGDPTGSCGFQREPGHYPLAQILPNLCVTDHLEYFESSCGRVGPAGTAQADHNYFYNCVFR